MVLVAVWPERLAKALLEVLLEVRQRGADRLRDAQVPGRVVGSHQLWFAPIVGNAQRAATQRVRLFALLPRGILGEQVKAAVKAADNSAVGVDAAPTVELASDLGRFQPYRTVAARRLPIELDGAGEGLLAGRIDGAELDCLQIIQAMR